MNSRKITKVIIGTVVIGSAIAYFLYEATESSWAYYYSVDEFVESQLVETLQNGNAGTPKTDDNRIIRLAGLVKPGTIVRNAEKMQLDFELAGQKSSVPVRFYGVMPKNFTTDKEVVVEGKASDNRVFQANKILTRCESKYKVKLNEKSDPK